MENYMKRLATCEAQRKFAILETEKMNAAYERLRLEVCLEIEQKTGADLKDCAVSLEKLCAIAQKLEG